VLGFALASAGLAAVTGAAQRSRFDEARDTWQRPDEVLDALAIGPGSRVADVGAGRGYFTFKISERVGSTGAVYAVDVKQALVNEIQQRTAREGLAQVQSILGADDDPHLPDGLDAVLVVDAYHEFREYDGMLAKMFGALRPGGRFVVIDGEAPEGRARTDYFSLHRIPASVVRREAEEHGFRFIESRPGFPEPGNRKQMYFLIFERPRL
jgi:predicted methyltransferase